MKILSGEKRIEFQAKWNKDLEMSFSKRCLTAADKQEKAFRIKAIENLILQKTKKVSVCCFAELSDRRFTNLNSFIK